MITTYQRFTKYMDGEVVCVLYGTDKCQIHNGNCASGECIFINEIIKQLGTFEDAYEGVQRKRD